MDKDGEPDIVFGTREDYEWTNGDEPVGVFSNNCSDKKDEVSDGYDVVRFGECSHPTSVDADAYAAATLLPRVIAAGGTFHTSSGHKTVSNSSPVGSYNTWLSYARGKTSP